MTRDAINPPSDAPAFQTMCRLGAWTAALTAVCAAVALVIGFLTPPLSGPGCVSGCFAYPYNNAAYLVPHDYFWMYPAILLAPLFLVLTACLHHYAANSRKLFGEIGLAFALVFSAAIGIDYFVQLTVMQPSLLKGETEGLALISMYNPHGIFIALEALGYLALSLSFFFTSWVLTGAKRLEGAISWLLRLGTIVTVVAFIGLSLAYGPDLEYRFEVTAISINWLVLVVGGILLNVFFRRAARNRQ